jgi:hypothetical protein
MILARLSKRRESLTSSRGKGSLIMQMRITVAITTATISKMILRKLIQIKIRRKGMLWMTLVMIPKETMIHGTSTS